MLMDKTKMVSIRMDQDLLARLHLIADQENRTFSAQVHRMLTQWLEANAPALDYENFTVDVEKRRVIHSSGVEFLHDRLRLEADWQDPRNTKVINGHLYDGDIHALVRRELQVAIDAGITMDGERLKS
jgi:hypothetical protein